MSEQPSTPTGPPDGTYTAVFDRVEQRDDGTEVAVLVIEADGHDVGEAVVERAALPETAQAVDSIVEVTVDSGVPTTIEARPAETEERADSAQSRFDRLSRRRRADDEDG